MIETCLDVLQNYFQFQNKKLEEKMTEISDLQIQNEALKKEKGAGRSIMKKVGDQMTTDKRQLEINFRRIEKDYDACREELKKQNKLRFFFLLKLTFYAPFSFLTLVPSLKYPYFFPPSFFPKT